MPETKIREIYLKMYGNPEKSAERIYEFLRTLPIEVRKNLQSLIDDRPLTKELEGRYVSSDGSD